jgi:hypothetical protein
MQNSPKRTRLRIAFSSLISRTLFPLAAPKGRSRRVIGSPEALEVRQLLSAVMSATLDNGVLTVSEIDGSTENNSLTVAVVGTDLVVSDANEQFIAAPAGGILSNGDKTLTIPLNLITSGLTLNSGAGDDAIDIGPIDAAFNGNLTVNGEAGSDTITFLPSDVDVGTGNVSVSAETILVNGTLTAGGSVNLTSTGNDATLTINAAVTAGADSKFASDKLIVNSSVNLGSHVLTVAPESAVDSGDAIDIGAKDDLANNTLQISNDELNQITAAKIVIGDAGSSTVTVSAEIEHSGDSQIQVLTGRNIVFNDGSGWSTANGGLSFVANPTALEAGNFVGIDLNRASLNSTGTGSITLNGHGGNTDRFNVGIYAHDGSVITSTGTGRIALTGVGGAGTGDNRGVELLDTAVSSTSGDIHITGHGGEGDSNWNIGVWLVLGATVSATGNARITIDGTAGSGSVENSGVLFNGFGNGGATKVTAQDGDITIIGQGPDAATDAQNRGIGVYEGTVIQATGIGGITMNGTGGAGTSDNRGIEIRSSGTLITVVDGNIQLTGHGGNTGVQNHGIYVVDGAVISSTGIGTISLSGEGGAAESSNRGIQIEGDGTSVTSALGNIHITGKGGLGTGPYNIGVWLVSGADVTSTGTATIWIEGTAGTGTDENSGILLNGFGNGGATRVVTQDGDLVLIGQGSDLTTGSGNRGIGIFFESSLRSTGNGKIFVNGTGGTGANGANGVEMSLDGALITSVTGDIQVSGRGGPTNSGYGIWMFDGAVVESTGTAKVMLFGSAGAANDGNGVFLTGIGKTTKVQTVDGDIIIDGVGSNFIDGGPSRGVGISNGSIINSTGTGKITIQGFGGLSNNGSRGVEIGDANTLVTSTTGDIQITGQGGPNGNGFGVWLRSGATVESTDTARIMINGNGGAGESSVGMIMNGYGNGGATRIMSRDGDIQVGGRGQNSETGNYQLGFGMFEGASIESTGLARINIGGYAGSGISSERGVEIGDANTKISSAKGNIFIGGYGGAGSSETETYNIGVWVRDGAVVESTGNESDAATINIDGRGGAGSGADIGVWFTGGGKATTVAGNMSISGKGADGAGLYNYGVAFQNLGSLVSTGAATIGIVGIGGDGTGLGNGLFLEQNSLIQSVDGDIRVTAIANGGGDLNLGIGVQSGSVIESTGDAKIDLFGVGGKGLTSSIGVRVMDSNSAIRSKDGDITVIGNAGGSAESSGNHGVVLQSGVIATTAGGTANVSVTGRPGPGSTSFGIQMQSDSSTIGINTSAGTGNIKLASDSIYIDFVSQPAAISAGSNSLTIQPESFETSLGLGSSDSSGILGLTDAELDRVTEGTLILGIRFWGTISVNEDITRPVATNVQLVCGGDVVITGGQIDTHGGTLLLDSGFSPQLVKPVHTGVDATASMTTLGGDLGIVINGLLADTDYSQLNVAGGIDLNGKYLEVSGSRVPMVGDTFTIVNNDGDDAIVGTFHGLAEGAKINLNGCILQISYVGGSGNDVVLTALNNIPQVSLNGEDVTFSKKKAKKEGPITILPNITVVDPDTTAGSSLGGGTLIFTVFVPGKESKKRPKFHDTIGGLSSASSLGNATSSVSEGILSLIVHFNPTTTAENVQAFLRSLTFSTKGAGLRQPPRSVGVHLMDAAGETSAAIVTQTIHVTK